MAKEKHDWQGRAILHPDHGQELEARSADLEFKDRMSRDGAEAQAYREYRRRNHMAAAAHHLRGMKSAQGSGDLDEARKHGAMYEMHMGKLGEEPWREPSRELKAAMQSDDRESVHKFKAHASDQFVVDEHKATKAAEEMSKSLVELHLKAKAVELLRKAFPVDPSQPVGSHLEPGHREAIANDAMSSQELADPHGSPQNQINAANRPRPSGKPIKMTSSKPLRNDQPMVPNKDQAGVAAGLKAAPSETHVLVDHLLEQGAQFTKPPAFEPDSAARAHPAEGGGRPGQPVTDADLGHVAALHPLQQANRQMSTQHPDLNPTNDPMAAFEVPGPAMMGTPNAWKSPSNIRNSEYLDSQFWSAVQRHAGRTPLSPEMGAKLPGIPQNELYDPVTDYLNQKAELPPGSPPAGMAAPAKPALHSSVEGFMNGTPATPTSPAMPGLKSLPKGSPERGRFITAHMNHPAFLSALQAHPQGPAVHAQLTSFMNSKANAGPGGPMKVVAKSLGDHIYDAIISTLPLPMQIAGHAAKAIFKPVLQPKKPEKVAKSEPQFVPGTHVHDGDRNLIVLKVHPARGADDKHLYTLRDPVDNTLSHAFESRLGPSKEQK